MVDIIIQEHHEHPLHGLPSSTRLLIHRQIPRTPLFTGCDSVPTPKRPHQQAPPQPGSLTSTKPPKTDTPAAPTYTRSQHHHRAATNSGFQRGYIKAITALETSLVNGTSPAHKISRQSTLLTHTNHTRKMSYGSYSSTSAMEIPSRRSGYHNSYLDESCAFPSWPRRVSLGEHCNDQPRATSYISDEDLLFLSEPVFADEDTHSVSSYGSGTPSPRLAPVRHMGGAELEEMRREQALRQQELMRSVMAEKEQRRQAAKAHKQRKSSSKKGSSPRSKLSAMTPIAEAVE